jgi:hypothetical protein
MNQLTNEEKCKVFTMYWGNVCFINGIGGQSVLSLIDCNDIGLGRISGKLLLTPLSSITDEDAIAVAKMATHLHDNNTWRLVKIVREKGMAKVYFKDLWNKHDQYDYHVKVAPFPLQGCFRSYKGEILDQQHYQFPLDAYDYLREKGYALPYKNKDLFELGIAIEKK